MINEYPSFIVPLIKEQIINNMDLPKGLDIGSGPLSMLAYGAYHGLFQLDAADPLAEAYKHLLTKYGFDINYQLIQCAGEDLTAKFPKDFF